MIAPVTKLSKQRLAYILDWGNVSLDLETRQPELPFARYHD